MAGVDSVVIRSITGHVTERMREHYSTVGLDEKHAALTGVMRLVTRGPQERVPMGTGVGTGIGTPGDAGVGTCIRPGLYRRPRAVARG